MNKRECRKLADPGLRFSPGSGVLFVEKIEHIVRSAVKNIAGRRTLVLYFYNRKEVTEGYAEPVYTLFQCRDDYITLEQSADGKEKWREASLDNLGARYAYFTKGCAFYLHSDELAVTRFCKIPEAAGFDALNALQAAIMCVRLNRRIVERERKIIERMKPVPVIPRGLKGWIHREVLPHYVFYDYTRGGKPMKGYCTACRSDVIVSGAKHNSPGICPCCKKKVTFKASGRAKRVWDRATVQVLQRVNNNELVLRIFKLNNWLRDWRQPGFSMYESTRVFIRYNDAKELKVEVYYYDYCKGTSIHWVKGERPRFSHYQYNFECDYCGRLYCDNLDSTLDGTPWQYSQLGLFARIDDSPMEVIPYLRAYIKYPAIEYLVKLGLTNLACSVIYTHDGAKQINMDGANYKDALGADAEGLSVLQTINADIKQLELYQHLVTQGIRADGKLLTWYRERNVLRKEDILVPLALMTPVNLMRYIDEQFERSKGYRTQYGGRRYESPGKTAADYRDYLSIGGKLGFNFSDGFVLFPKKLPEAHDQAANLYEDKKISIFSEMIQKAHSALQAQYRFTKGGLTLTAPKSADEIINEGHTLHHCVHTYVERVAGGECVVLFIRRTDAINEPFYTLEVQGNRVIQIHGNHHCKPTPEVEKFLEQWKRKKLATVCVPAAA